MWDPTSLKIQMKPLGVPKISSLCAPDDGSSDPKYVMWFRWSKVALTDRLLF